MRLRTLCGLLAVTSLLVAAGVATAVTTATINAKGAGGVKLGIHSREELVAAFARSPGA